MNINEYAKVIETKVAEIAGEEMAVTLNEKILNNGGVEYQITVGKKDSRIRPSINISHYVEEFGEDLDRIAHEILDTAMEHQNVEGFNPEDVLNKEYLLDKAVVQLVNKERNQEALTTRGAVTFDFLNLTAVIRIKALVGVHFFRRKFIFRVFWFLVLFLLILSFLFFFKASHCGFMATFYHFFLL